MQASQSLNNQECVRDLISSVKIVKLLVVFKVLSMLPHFSPIETDRLTERRVAGVDNVNLSFITFSCSPMNLLFFVLSQSFLQLIFCSVLLLPMKHFPVSAFILTLFLRSFHPFSIFLFLLYSLSVPSYVNRGIVGTIHLRETCWMNMTVVNVWLGLVTKRKRLCFGLKYLKRTMSPRPHKKCSSWSCKRNLNCNLMHRDPNSTNTFCSLPGLFSPSFFIFHC